MLIRKLKEGRKFKREEERQAPNPFADSYRQRGGLYNKHINKHIQKHYGNKFKNYRFNGCNYTTSRW